jgi:hypothetical protein
VKYFLQEGYEWISGGLRALVVLLADSREEAPWTCARCSSTNMSTSGSPKGGGQHYNGSEDDFRDGRSGEVWRPLPETHERRDPEECMYPRGR